MTEYPDGLLGNRHPRPGHGVQRLPCVASRDGFTEAGAKQLPSRLPAATLNQASHGQDSLSPGLAPSHTRLLHALGDQCLRGCFLNPGRAEFR